MNRTQDDIQDELLVLRYQSGDHEALRLLVARWQPRMIRLAWRLTYHREAALDLVQEAWLAVVRGLGRLDDPARLRVWAYRIVRNKCADWTRRQVVRRRVVGELCSKAASHRPEPSNRVDPADEIARLRDALSGIEAEHKAILSLFYLEGLSIREIADVFDVPEGTVKSRLFHARDRLKDIFERTEP